MPKVILYYHYTPIKDPQHLRGTQLKLAKKLGLKGRILISDQGINGTASGTDQAVEQYMAETNAYPGLEDLEWKISDGPAEAFPRLRVVVRDEIVTFGLKANDLDVDLKNKAPYIEPEELAKLYESGEDFLIVDARNTYESKIGKFENAVAPEIDTFREFPKFVQEKLANYKDKTVVTYCTGGIRCEKASAYLREQGFTNVRQLHGGVHRYSEHTGGRHFQGKLYVFDSRVQMDVNQVDPSIISNCWHCGQPAAEYTDCVNDDCNQHFICCSECRKAWSSACSESCQQQYHKLQDLAGAVLSVLINQNDLQV